MSEALSKAKASIIQRMSETELFSFGTEVSISDIDARSKEYLYRAIEMRTLELRDAKEFGYLVDEGDLKPEEFKP